jgi:hypothetical protein
MFINGTRFMKIFNCVCINCLHTEISGGIIHLKLFLYYEHVSEQKDTYTLVSLP